MDDHPRAQLDLVDYAERSQTSPCFISRIVDGTHDFPHGEIYRDEFAIAFLNRFPTQLGYRELLLDVGRPLLTSPREHEGVRRSVLDPRRGRGGMLTAWTMV